MRYEGNIFSPHIRGDDYILQCTIGCSHNACTFCDMYKDKRFHRRPLGDILEDIEMAKAYYGDVEKVFLGDGDALCLETADLVVILDHLYQAFPSLYYVGIYASPRSIEQKTAADLELLCHHGLGEAHLGVESGDDHVLKRICKGVDSAGMVAAGRKLKAANIPICATVILGLASYVGPELPSLGEQSARHADTTAVVLNAFAPEYIGFMSVMVQRGTKLYEEWQRGAFFKVDDQTFLEEMRAILASLAIETTVTSMHPSNGFVLDGHLPEDKPRLLAALDEVLSGKRPDLLRPRKTDIV